MTKAYGRVPAVDRRERPSGRGELRQDAAVIAQMIGRAELDGKPAESWIGPGPSGFQKACEGGLRRRRTGLRSTARNSRALR